MFFNVLGKFSAEKETMGEKTRVHYSEEEKIRLRKLVIAYKSIVEDKRGDSQTLLQKKEAWEKITEQHNSSGRHPPRTRPQLKKLWENIKCRMKHNHGMEKKKQVWLEDDQHILDIRSLSEEGSSTMMKMIDKMISKSRLQLSEEEKIRLRNLYISYEPIIENRNGDKDSLLQRKQAWDKLAEEFNCSGQFPMTTSQLKKLWGNIKYRIKNQWKLGGWPELTEDPNVVYFSENSHQDTVAEDSMTVNIDPSTIGSKEKPENEMSMNMGEGEMAEQSELHELKMKEAQLKILQLEKGMGQSDDLYMLQKKKLLLEIELLELRVENERKKLENGRLRYTEL